MGAGMYRQAPKPSATTLGDLCALVAGCALGLSLATRRTPYLEARASSGPIWNLVVGQEYLGKIACALLVTVLARRARLGGPLRPAEWLLLVVAMDWARSLLIFADMREALSERAFGDRYGVRGWWLWETIGLAVFAVSSVALALARRSLPAAAGFALLCVATLAAFWGPVALYEQAADALWERAARRYRLGASWTYAYWIAIGLLCRAVIGVPLIAMLRREGRADESDRGWPARLGAAVAILALLSELAMRLFPWPWPLPRNRGFPVGALAAWVVGWALSLALSFAALARLGPAWRPTQEDRSRPDDPARETAPASRT